MARWAGRKIARLRAAVLALYGSTCVLCHEPIDLERTWPDSGSFSLEHVRPRSLGGSDALGNLRPSHLGCNTARGNRPTVPDRRPHHRGRFSTQAATLGVGQASVSPESPRKNG